VRACVWGEAEQPRRANEEEEFLWSSGGGEKQSGKGGEKVKVAVPVSIRVCVCVRAACVLVCAEKKLQKNITQNKREK